jgi:hypothetical protein
MELVEVLKKLSDEEQKVVTDSIEQEKARGIQESRKKGEEIKKGVTALNGLRDRFKALGLDPDDEALDEKIDAAREKLTGKKENAEMLRIQRELKTMSDKLAAQEKEKEELNQRYTFRTLSESLRKSIGDKIQAPDYVIAGLIRDGKVKIVDDKTVWVFGDGEVDNEKGSQRFVSENPGLVKNTQPKGGESQPGAGSQQKKTMPRAEWEALGPKERATFINSGGMFT